MNIPAPPKWWWIYNSFLTCGRGQIFDMGRLIIPWGFGSDHSYSAIWSWVDITDDRCGPMEWSRVVLPQDHDISRLDVVGWAMPSLAMLQLMEIISRPPFPEVLELLLECLPPRQSTHFDVWVVNGRQLGEWFSNQEMSRGKIGVMWIIWKSTKGSGVEASLNFS